MFLTALAGGPRSMFAGRPIVNAVHHADAIQLMQSLPDESIDMIASDPPYGISEASWDKVPPLDAFWREAMRVIAPDGAIVITAAEPFTSQLIVSNLEHYRYSWVWYKTVPQGFLNAPHRPLKLHEDIAVFSRAYASTSAKNQMRYYPQKRKGDAFKRVAYGVNTTDFHNTTPSNERHVGTVTTGDEYYPDSVLKFPNPNNGSLHPTQKPVQLFEYLVRTYTLPGDVVLDPYAGSGTTAIAAQNLGRFFIVSEIQRKYVDVIRARLAGSKADARRAIGKTARSSTLPMFSGADFSPIGEGVDRRRVEDPPEDPKTPVSESRKYPFT